MANITAAMVKDLREKTGAGMMDCKGALNETGGDIEAAIDWLRKKGLSKAAKKSGRVAAEGLVGVAVHGANGVVVEVNSETDFVARNEEFQALVKTIALVAIEKGDDRSRSAQEPALSRRRRHGRRRHFQRHRHHRREHDPSPRRGVSVTAGVIGQYVHTAVTAGLGKIGVIVALESTGDKEALAELGRKIAMHVAAAGPLALDASGIDPAVLEREKNVLREKNAGKPANVLEKIVESGMKTYFKEVTLLEQPYIHDNAKTVAQAVAEAAKTAGAPIVLKGFVRYGLGEGIEKQESDFAAEVAAAVSGDA